MIEIQQMMVTTLWTPLLHSHVILDMLWMEIPQQVVKYQETGTSTHQLALVIKCNNNIIFVNIFCHLHTSKFVVDGSGVQI